jgi:D-alanyl-D-alanine carboxypeptidase
MNLINILKENKKLIISAIFIVILFSVFFIKKNEKEDSIIKENQAIEKKMQNYLPTLSIIKAKSFYVYDILENKAIFSKDEHLKLPLASITKLMSGLVVLDIMPETTLVTIGQEDLALGGDYSLVAGEKWKLKDLLDYSLIESSNAGMHAIASTLNYYEAINNKDIVKIMNERAAVLGLNDTIFINETGLDVDNNMSGAYSSAYDISILFEKILKDNPALITSTNKTSQSFVSESNIKHTAVNTDTAINEISGMIASKTGLTDLAGGNLAIVFDAGLMHPVVIVVLGSSAEGRFSDAINLAKITLEKLSE